MDEKYIFISYAHLDHGRAIEITNHFEELGYNVWYDAHIRVMDKWSPEINRKIFDSEIFLAFISNNYVKSESCLNELKLAMDNDKKILLVYLQEKVDVPCDIEPLLERQAVYFTRFPGIEEFISYLTSVELFVSCKNENYFKEKLKEKTPVPKRGTDNLSYSRVHAKTEDGQIYYTMAVSIGECTDANVIVPDLDPDYTVKVTNVELCGFKDSYIETITLPVHLRKIGASGFCNCRSLKSVRFTSELEEIGPGAFSECKSLEYVTLPPTTRKIESGAFSGSGLKSIKLSDKVSVIERDTFKMCLNLEKADLSEGVRKIEKNAFSRSGIKEIEFPSTLKEIEEGAFEECKELEKVQFSCGLATVGKNAFSQSGIKMIELPNTLKEIGEGAFSRCVELEEVRFSGGVTTIGKNAFYGCSALKSISFCQGLRVIEKGAFSYSQIEEAVLPKGLTVIESEAFKYCDNLKRVVIRSGVKRIGYKAFENCRNLKEIYIPSTVTELMSLAPNAAKRIKIYCEADQIPSEWYGLTDGLIKPKIILGAKMPKE